MVSYQEEPCPSTPLNTITLIREKNIVFLAPTLNRPIYNGTV